MWLVQQRAPISCGFRPVFALRVKRRKLFHRDQCRPDNGKRAKYKVGHHHSQRFTMKICGVSPSGLHRGSLRRRQLNARKDETRADQRT
jgi:hypothetical protein